MQGEKCNPDHSLVSGWRPAFRRGVPVEAAEQSQTTGHAGFAFFILHCLARWKNSTHPSLIAP
jgi:hypothetical protein